jgi:hypothetical protein
MGLRIKIRGFCFKTGLPVLSTGGISFQRVELIFFSIEKTANVDYRLSFAGKENKLSGHHGQTSIFHFLFAENKRKFAVSVFRLQQINGSFPFPYT